MEGNLYETERTLEALLKEFPLSEQRAPANFLLAQLRTSQQRYAEAADAYAQYLKLRPGRIEGYIFDLRGDAYLAAQDFPSAIKDFETALLSSSRLDQTFLRMKLARSYALSGDTPTALTLYDDLYTRVTDDNTRALIDLRKAEIYTAAGQVEKAQAAYLDAVQNFPTSPYAYQALAKLVDSGVEVDQLQRGIIDYFAAQYGPAQSALNRYLQSKPADASTAHFYYGLSARAAGDYAAAIEHWDAVIQGPKESAYWDRAWEEKAYTQWAYLDQYKEAEKTLLDFVAAAGNHARAAEFLNDAAQVAERDARLQDAADTWERIVKEYPGSPYIPRALFLAGIAHYRLADYAYALDEFERHLAASQDPYDQAAGRFWMGKAYQKLDNPAAARASFEKAVEADPTSYYSERARDILLNRPPFDPPLTFSLEFDQRGERAVAEDWLRQRFNLPPAANLSDFSPLASDPGWQRGDELWRLGLYDDARLEFEGLREAYASDPAQSYRLAGYLISIGAYRPGIMAARAVLDQAGMNDATSLDAPAYFSHLRFGPYYGDLVLPLATEYTFHPLFLFSVIRQESLFEGFAASSAGANGLMQIVPATGQEMAGELGWPDNYSAADLTRPIVNLRLGAHYLNKQRRLFDGDLYAALAAYNAGPGNAQQWKKLAPDDPDLYLEVIRYAETRDYIRKIYEIFSIYRKIYEK
jgi:soluble lytic murein transglycosylase